MMILTIDRCKGRSIINLTEAYWYGLYFYCGKGRPGERVYEDFVLLPLVDMV
ncbi:MAG TPA: hypothetical protein VMW09_07010 [Desulfatiglandales bacterium]|nr:hypothetical protein [Desulfatiglandales bacterium]